MPFPVSPTAIISALELSSAGAGYGQFLGWNGSHWVPMYVTTINLSPNTIGITLGTTGSDLNVSNSKSDFREKGWSARRQFPQSASFEICIAKNL